MMIADSPTVRTGLIMAVCLSGLGGCNRQGRAVAPEAITGVWRAAIQNDPGHWQVLVLRSSGYYVSAWVEGDISSPKDFGMVDSGKWHVSGDLLTAVAIEYIMEPGLGQREAGREEFRIIEASNERLVLRGVNGGPVMKYDRVEESQASYLRSIGEEWGEVVRRPQEVTRDD